MILGTPKVTVRSTIDNMTGIETAVVTGIWDLPQKGLSPVQKLEAASLSVNMGSRFKLIGSQTEEEPGRMRTLLTYQGECLDGLVDRENAIDFGYEPGLKEVPIAVLPNFQQLLKQYGGYWDQISGEVIWPQLLSSQAGRALSAGSSNGKPNPMFGHSTRYSPDGTYRCRYASKKSPDQDGIGYIADDLPGEPPKVGDGRNWLFVGAPYRRRGYVFEVTELYWLSPIGGWPAPLYKADGKRSTGLTTGHLSSGNLGGSNTSWVYAP